VALDVARILAKTADELRHTDIAAHALDELAQSRIREIHIVGRRGPIGTKFAAKELMEFEELGECDPVIEGADAAEVLSAAAAGADAETAATLAALKRFAAHSRTRRRCCIFRFNLDPLAIRGDGQVERMLFRQGLRGPASDDAGRVTVDCDLVLSSIGRRCAPLAGVPYDQAKGVHSNLEGRIVADGMPSRGLYVCGWSKRGPFGTIGTNRACSVDTISQVLADLPRLEAPPAHPDTLLAGIAHHARPYIDYVGWERIDAEEIARGRALGKPREKFVLLDEMITAAGGGLGW
jgi:ferredoxin--NADP+ reductase